jgi:UDP-N-acetylglucosamine 2-epimerase (non-hydrolysing)
LNGTPAESDLKDSYSLGIRSEGDVKSWLNQAILRISNALPAQNAIVVVQGDTMSAYATALAASDLGLPIAHVEAGLRSHCLTDPDPEERFRVEISKLARLHFCPTTKSAENLAAEGITEGVFVTGNTVVSALARYASLEPLKSPENQVLVTMHRREFLNCGTIHVRSTFKSLETWALAHPDTRIVVPMHPALRLALKPIVKHVPPNVLYVQPLGYAKMIAQLRRSRGVLSDSGGLSEEAATLGVPCAVMRNVTDRPEAIEAGVAKLFPPNPDGIVQALTWLCEANHKREPAFCFGGPESARTVAQLLSNHLS